LADEALLTKAMLAKVLGYKSVRSVDLIVAEDCATERPTLKPVYLRRPALRKDPRRPEDFPSFKSLRFRRDDVLAYIEKMLADFPADLEWKFGGGGRRARVPAEKKSPRSTGMILEAVNGEASVAEAAQGAFDGELVRRPQEGVLDGPHVVVSGRGDQSGGNVEDGAGHHGADGDGPDNQKIPDHGQVVRFLGDLMPIAESGHGRHEQSNRQGESDSFGLHVGPPVHRTSGMPTWISSRNSPAGD
jgi:hypothetical protein